jgi:hypothetical protein
MDCAICLEPDVDVVTHCNHMFHKQCIHEWIKMNTSCPNCRTPLELTRVQKLDDSIGQPDQMYNFMSVVYDCVSQIRAGSIDQYTNEFAWSSLQEVYRELSNDPNGSNGSNASNASNATPYTSFNPFKIPIRACSRTVQSLHVKAAHMLGHLDSFFYIDLYVSYGTWKVRSAFYCGTISKFVKVCDCKETTLGALIPSYSARQDTQNSMENAYEAIWSNFYEWLCCHVDCNLLYIEPPDASLYTV